MSSLEEAFRNILDLLILSKGVPVAEDIGSLRIGPLQTLTQKALDATRDLSDLVNRDKAGQIFLRGSVTGVYDLSSVRLEETVGEEVHWIYQKPSMTGVWHMVRLEALASCLRTSASFPKEICCFFDLPSFATYTTAFLRYGERLDSVGPGWSGAAEAARFVRDFSRQDVLPQDLSQCLLAPGCSLRLMDIPVEVRTAFCLKLLPCLCSEIDGDPSGAILLRFGIERSTVLRIADIPNSAGEWFAELSAACEWTFSEPQQAETRHTLISEQLAVGLSGSGPNPTSEVFRSSLDGARRTFRYYISESNKDALRSLADLRSAITTETRQATDRVMKLASNLWRDFLVAGASSSVGLLSNQTVPGTVKSTIGLIAGVYLGASVLISWVFSLISLLQERANRIRWYPHLYPFLGDADTNILIRRPIRRAHTAFGFASLLIFGAYGLLIYVVTRILSVGL